jgi:hypothetical protein
MGTAHARDLGQHGVELTHACEHDLRRFPRCPARVGTVQLRDGPRIRTATDDAYPKGYVDGFSESTAKDLGRTSGLTTWLLCFRNSDPNFEGIQPETWRTTRQTRVIEGRECFGIERLPEVDPRSFFRCWIDPRQGHQIVRREAGVGEHVFRAAEASYERRPDYGFIPTAWRETSFVEHDELGLIMFEDKQFTVHRVDINEPFTDAPFDFEFPPGTWVDDSSGGPGARRSYLVKDHDIKRPIDDVEMMRGAGYQDLLRTESGQAKRPVPPDSRNLWFWGSVALLVLAGAIYLRTRS